MKKMIILFVLFISYQSNAADFFTGHWVGSGKMNTIHSPEPSDIKLDIRIEQSNEVLVINDCWIISEQTQCYKSTYKIQNDGEIYEDARKIGDLYPTEIKIFNGNSQVSEQMIFRLNGKHELRYRYSYLNEDGQMETRAGDLQPLNSIK